jgi:hypothetical protein
MDLKVFLFLALNLLVSNAIQAGEIKPFKSDGCSSFPNGTFEQNELWLKCCTAHDYDCWKGGTYSERLESNKALETCVAQVGEPEVALLMLAGVRVGGTPFFPTTFRWGYGWGYPRFYGPLTDEEIEKIEKIQATDK